MTQHVPPDRTSKINALKQSHSLAETALGPTEAIKLYIDTWLWQQAVEDYPHS